MVIIISKETDNNINNNNTGQITDNNANTTSALKRLFELCEKSVEFDGWVKKTGMVGYCKEIINESKEISEALENKDYDNLKEELGDVLMDLFEACLLAEHEGHFSTSDVFSSAISKIERRRPYLEKNKKVTPEESVEYWLIAKEKEKNKNQ